MRFRTHRPTQRDAFRHQHRDPAGCVFTLTFRPNGMRFRAHIPTQRKAAVCLRGKKKMREEEVDRGSQLAAAVLLAPFLSSWSACCSPPSLRAVLRLVHVPLLVLFRPASVQVAPLFPRCAAAASTRRWVARASVGLSPFLPLLSRGRHSPSSLPLSFLSPLPARPWHRTTYPSRCDPRGL
jgi:hypothetical protein